MSVCSITYDTVREEDDVTYHEQDSSWDKNNTNGITKAQEQDASS